MRAAPLFNNPSAIAKGASADDLPFMRPHIAGWAKDDVVLFPDPRSPTLERKGRVLTSLPRFGVLVLRAERPDAIVEIEPARCRLVRRSLGEAGKVNQ